LAHEDLVFGTVYLPTPMRLHRLTKNLSRAKVIDDKDAFMKLEGFLAISNLAAPAPKGVGTVGGQVLDQQDKPVVGVHVTLQNSEEGNEILPSGRTGTERDKAGSLWRQARGDSNRRPLLCKGPWAQPVGWRPGMRDRKDPGAF